MDSSGLLWREYTGIVSEDAIVGAKSLSHFYVGLRQE
jgi:hypothetical protein